MRRTEPFGERAIKMGFVSEEEVQRALETQKLLGIKEQTLADILLELGKISSEDYYKVLEDIKNAEKDLPAGKDSFCERVKQLKLITEEDEEVARVVQEKWQKRTKLLGEIMVELGDLSGEQLQQILNTYRAANNK